jgi:hypothetical protein
LLNKLEHYGIVGDLMLWSNPTSQRDIREL